MVLADRAIAGASLYAISNAKPGEQPDLVYPGHLQRLASTPDVRLYTPSSIGALGPYVYLYIEPGAQASPSFPNLPGFAPFACPRT